MVTYLAALILALTGQPTPVHCTSMPGQNWLGYTVTSGDSVLEIGLRPDMCKAISSRDPFKGYEGWAVLGHEAVHAMHPHMVHEDLDFDSFTYWNMERLLCMSGRGSEYRRMAVFFAFGPKWDGRCETPRPETTGGI